MKAFIVVNESMHQNTAARTMHLGLKKHGVDVKVGRRPPRGMDFLVCWGQRQMVHHKEAARNTLVMERAYFEDRFHWMAVGWNGLNGKANFLNKNSPSDRWEKYFNDGRLLPWSDGEYILITTQIIGDASLTGITVDYNKIADSLLPLNIPIKVRYHPGSKIRPNSQNLLRNKSIEVVSNDEPLLDQIKNAKALVTISSNTGVDAILAGTPVLNYSKYSMVWDLAMKDPKEILNPPFPDRSQWCYDTAYAQWLPQEIENGDAWDHLKLFLDK